jgi:hypothetical protein
VLNEIVINAGLHPTNVSEREGVQQHLQQSQSNDLVLCDCGYPAFRLYALLEQHERTVCMRAKTKLDLRSL